MIDASSAMAYDFRGFGLQKLKINKYISASHKHTWGALATLIVMFAAEKQNIDEWRSALENHEHEKHNENKWKSGSFRTIYEWISMKINIGAKWLWP